MPSRKVKSSCAKCAFKNEVGSRYCNHCGAQVSPQDKDDTARDAKAEHRDIAHPVTQKFREYLQSRILEAYKQEVEHPSSSAIDDADA